MNDELLNSIDDITFNLRKDNQEDASLDYFQKIALLNVKSLREYYELVKIQTKRGFMIALIACILGFLLIITPVAFDLASQTYGVELSRITTISGIIVELISGLFFYLYSLTVKQLKEYHKSLVQSQNILLSFKLIDDIEDENAKIPLIQEIVRELVDSENARMAAM